MTQPNISDTVDAKMSSKDFINDNISSPNKSRPMVKSNALNIDSRGPTPTIMGLN